MSPIAKGLCWAAVLLVMSLFNAHGWINDKDANLMFVLVPALWIATSRPRQCLPRRKVSA